MFPYVLLYFAFETIVAQNLPATFDVKTCSKPGEYLCTDACTTLVKCFKVSNTTYSAIQVETCNTNQMKYCNATSADCSGRFCEDGGEKLIQFICHSPGIFPDPYDCTIYHTCNDKLEDQRQICPQGKAFNLLFRNCSLGFDARPCREGPMPKCENVGQTQASPDDSSVFSVCGISPDGYLLHQFVHCNAGFYFDAKSNACEPRTNAASSNFLHNGAIFIIMFNLIYLITGSNLTGK